jgi:hypothetical protein
VPNFAVNALGVGNTINPATVTALGNWASIIAGVLSGHGLTLGVAHFSRLAYTTAAGKPVPARPPGIVPVLSVLVRDNHWDSQRRRGRK